VQYLRNVGLKIATSSSFVIHLDTEDGEGSDGTMTTEPKKPELLEGTIQ
jgi:hypothetical protein